MHNRPIALLIALLAVFAAAACEPEPQDTPGRYKPPPFQAMGTDGSFLVIAGDEDAVEEGVKQARQAVERVEALMSTYRPESDVSRVNRAAGGEPVAVDEETIEVIREAMRMAEATGGAFEVTYAPLRSVWRRAAEQNSEPTDEEISNALALVGVDKIRIEDGKIALANAGMEVDLGGIAKGHAIDRAAEALQEAGATGGIVDIGHDLRLFGQPEDGGKWRVGVRKPPGVERNFILEVGPCAVTTSGDYARGFMVENKWFSHIIDPRTGRPATDVTSVTVVGPDATTADALATALSVMGPEEGLRLVDRMDDVECMFMTRMPHGGVEFAMSAGFDTLVVEE